MFIFFYWRQISNLYCKVASFKFINLIFKFGVSFIWYLQHEKKSKHKAEDDHKIGSCADWEKDLSADIIVAIHWIDEIRFCTLGNKVDLGLPVEEGVIGRDIVQILDFLVTSFGEHILCVQSKLRVFFAQMKFELVVDGNELGRVWVEAFVVATRISWDWIQHFINVNYGILVDARTDAVPGGEAKVNKVCNLTMVAL